MSDLKSEMSEGPASSQAQEPTTVEDIYFIDPKVIKSLKLKADIALLPILAITYLFNSLDRSNLSNAKTAGIDVDLGLVGNQFNLILTYYFIPFVLFGPFVGLMSKHFTAKYTIPFMMVGFGSASLGSAFVKNFGQMVACRILVGTFESGFITTIVFYLSNWYTRKEIASRIGIFYMSLVTSSAFGGLISYGVFQLHNPGVYSWFYLFIIEGSLTLAVSIVAFIVLPKTIRSAWFLNDAEKDAGERRILADSVETLSNLFSWREALYEFSTPHPYIRMAIAMCQGILLTSNANFLAIIVARLGYSVVKTNLYTVAPSLVAAVVLCAASFSSDFFNERGLHMVAAFLISVIGYSLMITVDLQNEGLTYFAIFLTTVGAYPMSPINPAWIVSNIPNPNARALTTAVLISIGNSAGLITSNIFVASEAPRYISALRTNLGAAISCMIICFSYTMWMRRENARRDRLQQNAGSYITEGVMGSKDIRFRFLP